MTPVLVIAPIALQGAVMLVDEAVCHRRRGLPRWERIGHPLDTLTMLVCIGWLVARPSGAPHTLAIYAGLAIFSTLFITKDEPIHNRLCTAGEQWLHAMLFVLHPIVLGASAAAWWLGWHHVLLGQLVIMIGFLAYQIAYWNLLAPRELTGRTSMGHAAASDPRWINNDWYGELGARWYTADDNPIALLRAESRHRNPWLAAEIERCIGPSARVLDLGCGAGFLVNYLAARDHQVTGIDTQAESLEVARHFDRSGRANYQVGDACALPFADGSFDVVCAMDLIEHIDEPAKLVAEASRVLAPGGLLFFHTFNRNWLCHLIVIKGVEWFVANTPHDLHVIRLFRTPAELTGMMRDRGMEPVELFGSRPRFRWPLWRMLFTRRVGEDFQFTFTRSTRLGYTGYARKA